MRKRLLNLCMMAFVSVIGTAAYALDKVDGVYQIGTADDLKEFAELVNGGDTYACAVLTADIDKGTDGTMIGSDANRFRGIFDGKGHTITVNSFAKADGQAIFRNLDGNALVQNLKVKGTITTEFKEAAGIAGWGRGTIRNCWVDLTVESSVNGDGTHAGIIGVADEGLVVENCLAQFTVNGTATTNCGGIAGWANGAFSIANCLVINDGTLKTPSDCGTISRNPGNLRFVDIKEYTGVGKGEDFEVGYGWRPRGASYNNYATKEWKQHDLCTIDPEGVKSGKVCYQLNHDQSTIAWVQNIGEDEFPVPAVFGAGKKQVYASAETDCSGKAEGELTYSNSGSNLATKHTTDKFGVCTTCGHMEFENLERDIVDNSYIAKTAADLDWLEGRNRTGNGGWFNISLGNDIEYTAEPGKMIFNNDNWYGGNLDGRGHTLTFEFTDVDQEHAGLIPHMRGSVKNLVVNGTVISLKNNASILIGTSEGDTKVDNVEIHGYLESTGQYAGTLVGRLGNGGITANNIYSDAKFHSRHIGDNTSGGLVGLPDKDWRLTNAIYAGDITAEDGAECIGSFAGWSAGNGHLTNVAFLGSMSGMSGDSHAVSRNPGKVNFYSKFYYVNDFPGGVKIADNEAAAMEQIDADDVESGKLAFMLNGNVQGGENFYQVIGTDPTPKPFAKDGAKVYVGASSYLCDGTPVGDVKYSNTEAGSNIPAHSFTDGICEVCGHVEEDYLLPAEDGIYEVSTPEQLRWWSYYASTVDLGASIRLTEDIDMGDLDEFDTKTGKTIKSYALIGNEATPFYGSFDGQFHTISNLSIEYPGNRGVGLIGVMNSRASKTDGVSDDNARNAVGTFIKDVVMDETCQIIGGGYAGLVGMTAEWAGHVTFKNVGLDCDVTCTTGANAGGVLGCVMGSTCHITIDNCYMTGNVYGTSENGAFSGWLGSYCEIKNCYAIGEVEAPESKDNHKYFARYNSATITNCYTLHGGTVNEDKHFVGKIEEEDIATGKLCYLLNGNQFKDCFYYQNIDEDLHPVANPSHGAVALLGDTYFGITEDNLDEAAEIMADYAEAKNEVTPAYTGAKETWVEEVEKLEEATSIAEFADALEVANKAEAAVDASAKVYAAYVAKCKETIQYLSEHDDFEGPLRDSLEEYLTDPQEPSAKNPLGTYLYLAEAQDAEDELVAKETERVAEWLAKAIAQGVASGTEVTSMLANANFSDGFNGWEGKLGTGTGSAEVAGKTVYGAETWATTSDIHQTLTDMKPGMYLVHVTGAYRPNNDRYSLNHVAQIYANDDVNFLQTVIEDYIDIDDAVDGVNCHTSGATVDLGIYDDFTATSDDNTAGATKIGWAVHGPHGLAIAGTAGRYQNYIATTVGKDGKLTIGIKNDGSGIGSDWTGYADVRVIYLGSADDDAAANVAKALNSQLARAEAILSDEYEAQVEDAEPDVAKAPNFPAEIVAALEAAVATAKKAVTPAEMMASVEELSNIFKQILEGKKAYIQAYDMGNTIIEIAQSLVGTLTDEEYAELLDSADDIFAKYGAGEYSIEEALNLDVMKQKPLVDIVAPKVGNVYQISKPLNLVYFGSKVTTGDNSADAVLLNDIDMSGIDFTPIGANGDVQYHGTFDGKGFAISNLTIGSEDFPYGVNRAALFNRVNNGTIKNVVIKNADVTSAGKFIAGLVGEAGDKTTIDNCDVQITMHSYVEGDGTHAGILGVAHKGGIVISNCKVQATMIGENTDCCGGVIGWSDENDVKVSNCLVINDVEGLKPGLNGCNSISRNEGNVTTTNTFYTTKMNGGEDGATQISLEDAMFASGELAWKLNGSTAEGAHWFQTLGEDAMPHLFGGDVVYLYGGEYTNEKPNPQLNAYAYALEAGSTENDVTVSYSLNAEAKAVNINFYNGTTKVATVAAAGDELRAGQHAITLTNSELGVPAGTELSYEVEVDGIGTKEAKKVGDSYKVWSPYGMAVNNVPTSAGFGQMYLIESDTDASPKGYLNGAYTGYISDYKHNAVYAFTPEFEQILGSDGTPGFTGGITPMMGNSPTPASYLFDLKTVRVSNDGRVFVSRANGLTNSPIMEANPADLEEAWTPVFTGGELDKATGITYVGSEEQSRMVYSFDAEGEGENLKLWTLGGAYSNGNFNYTDYVCNSYNLGTAKAWTSTPSSTLAALTGVYTIGCGPINILSDQRGGLWYIQYRANPSDAQPALVHVNKDGVVDYFNSSFVCNEGGMTISADGSRLAYPRGNTTYVVEPTYDTPNAVGMISLTPVATVKTEEDKATSMAFDYAGNLYVASRGTESVSLYAVPYAGLEPIVTPGAKTIVVGAEDISDAINSLKAAGFNTTDAIYNVAGQRVQKAENGIFIQNGKKVSVK